MPRAVLNFPLQDGARIWRESQPHFLATGPKSRTGKAR